MTVSALAAAKHLAQSSGWSLSNLELQKLLYLAHMFFLGRTGGTPLVRGNFEAWDYGPVHPDVYQRAKIFGSDPVKDIFHDIGLVPHGAERDILNEAYDNIGHAGAGRLVAATHRADGAWAANYVPGVRHCVIPNAEILAEYLRLEEAGDAAVA